MKILVVIDGDSSEPIAYSNKIDVSFETEITAAMNQLAIPHTSELIADIISDLHHGRAYWHAEKWCFDIINV